MDHKEIKPGDIVWLYGGIRGLVVKKTGNYRFYLKGINDQAFSAKDFYPTKKEALLAQKESILSQLERIYFELAKIELSGNTSPPCENHKWKICPEKEGSTYFIIECEYCEETAGVSKPPRDTSGPEIYHD